MSIIVNKNQCPEPSPRHSVLAEYGLNILENYTPGRVAPEAERADILAEELFRLGILRKQLQSFEVSMPSVKEKTEPLGNAEVLTGYSTSTDRKRYYFYKDDFRGQPYVLIATKSSAGNEINIKYFDNEGVHEIKDHKIASKVYKVLGDLHQSGIRYFEPPGAYKPYT